MSFSDEQRITDGFRAGTEAVLMSQYSFLLPNLTADSDITATGLYVHYTLWQNIIRGEVDDAIFKTEYSYYAGDATLDDMKNAINEQYGKLKQINEEIGGKTGIYRTGEYLVHIVASEFRRIDALAAVNTNDRKDWLYYNAKHYNMSRDIDKVIRSFCANALQEVERVNPDLNFDVVFLIPPYKGKPYDLIHE